MFHDIRAQQEARGLDPWAPFTDAEEWGLVKWLVSRVGQNAIDEFMKLPLTSHLKTSFTSKYSLMKAINQLLRGTEWQLKRISVEGNKLTNEVKYETEDLELWMRDPVECIHELMANPEFNHMVSYVPERVFSDAEGKTRWFDEMWTGDWWWEMQGRLPQGAIVAPFWGDQEVWPVYLSLRNISKNLECFMRDMWSLEHYRLFHYCMLLVLEPLVRVGAEGVDVTCPDHQVRHLYPIIAAYIADFPEQCLVACCMKNRCPKCVKSPMCDQDSTVKNLRLHCDGEIGKDQFEGELGLRVIYSPFWATLPHNDIFSCITPDILHQLHKGVFKDHICVFLGVIAVAVENKVLTAVRGVLDFVYYAQYRTHMDDTLAHMHAALTSFHANKDIFVDLGVCEHFNIPKIHSMIHYIDAIRFLSSADSVNTELPEQLHIDFTTQAYCASNQRDYIIQMTTWLQRQESIHIQDAYLRWWGSHHPVNQGSKEQDSDASDSDSDLDGAGPGLFENHVDLPSQVQWFTMVTGSHGYFVPRTCPFPNSTMQRLLNDHDASLFIPALEEFLQIHVPSWSRRKLTPQDQCLFKVHASPVIPASDVRRPPAPAHFDSVLVIEDGNEYTGEGLRVGEVQVVFKLPSHLGNFPHPLAYIHWFRPLQTFDENLHSFHLSRSSRQRGPNALVVLVHQVLHPCHLIPRVGRESGMREDFYLNRYIDLELFDRLSVS
ncbi:hypothetical protein DFH29DRAFT_985800 [Suillus ampliporus]|nr:hypothetical protein DFH29DRAFT_985800 [Suillus ampliporus]